MRLDLLKWVPLLAYCIRFYSVLYRFSKRDWIHFLTNLMPNCCWVINEDKNYDWEKKEKFFDKNYERTVQISVKKSKLFIIEFRFVLKQ